MKINITIPKDEYDLIGPHSLLGKVAKHDRFDEFLEASTQHVHLQFETSSMAFRQKNGGPEAMVLSEISIPGVAEAVLHLANEYDEVTIEDTGA